MATIQSNISNKVDTAFLYLVSTYSEMFIKHPLYLPTQQTPMKNERAMFSFKSLEKIKPI